MDLNDVRLNFNKDSLFLLNLFVAFIMFGIALDLKKADFLNLLKNPKPAFAGIFSQFIILPLLTLAILYTLNPHPGLALGMILVAVCPGGNMSNFFSLLAGSNLALSIGLTAFSSTVSVFTTPLGFFFWGSLYPPSQTYLRSIALNPSEMFVSILFILITPLLLGIVFSYFFPRVSNKLKKPIRYFSLALLVVFIIGALAANLKYFLSYIHILFGLVFLMNAAGLFGGYFFAKILKLPIADRRTIAIETGIQNSGLGLALVFGFFDGLGSMALICAWWGIWHLISGWSLATYWNYQAKKANQTI
ncbi:bile acid:sodium symporter family protein [Leptospira ilyithenensis]|uniref:Bile acid:sodium symporter family protein n=1 Tax=Leptospira ilyithenensis TaxID=2484901 RepID=A0A4R9LS63_9LEPT|nr:bile acid:sodium symporter family protein [Leptospira ilyithenensis]TGN11659.1 bile acid:sodium symporter family protein [Leptospira ilyithenensis]